MELLPKSSKEIIKDYFGKLVIGAISYTIAYGFLHQLKLPSESMLYLLCFAGAVWGIVAMSHKEDNKDAVLVAGIWVFTLFFAGYWLLKLIRVMQLSFFS